MVRRLNEWGRNKKRAPSPKVVPLQEPVVFHNDFSRRTVALHASVVNRTKVPVHVSKGVRNSLKLSTGRHSSIVLFAAAGFGRS